jgi:hypothetical protein
VVPLPPEGSDHVDGAVIVRSHRSSPVAARHLSARSSDFLSGVDGRPSSRTWLGDRSGHLELKKEHSRGTVMSSRTQDCPELIL